MFERSPIASYLTPLATTIVWGMSFASLLVVFVIPSLIVVIDATGTRLRRLCAELRQATSGLVVEIHPR